MDKEIKFYLPERCQQYETCVHCSNAWSHPMEGCTFGGAFILFRQEMQGIWHTGHAQ